MKVKGVPRLVANEYPEAMPWIARLLSPLNEALGSMFLALTRNLTFADNMYCSVKELEFTHGVELTGITHGLRSYLGAFIISTPEDTAAGTAVAAWKIRREDNESLAITVYFTGAGTTAGNVKFIIVGG